MNRSGIQPYQKSKQHLREPEMQQSLHLREPDLPQAILQKSVMIDQSSIRQSTVFSIEIDLDAEMKMAGKTIKFDRTPKKDKPKEQNESEIEVLESPSSRKQTQQNTPKKRKLVREGSPKMKRSASSPKQIITVASLKLLEISPKGNKDEKPLKSAEKAPVVQVKEKAPVSLQSPKSRGSASKSPKRRFKKKKGKKGRSKSKIYNVDSPKDDQNLEKQDMQVENGFEESPRNQKAFN